VGAFCGSGTYGSCSDIKNIGEDINMERKYRLRIKITENDIKRQVKNYLDVKGFFHFHILQGLGAFRGIPDMIAVKAGRVIFLEIKKPGGKLSEHQQRFKETMGGAGGEYYVVRSLEEIMKILEV